MTDVVTKAARGGQALDINAETYPFDFVQRLLDQAAFFNFYSRTVRCVPFFSRRRITGFHLTEELCRFSILTPASAAGAGIRVRNLVGEPLARFEHRWLLMPDTHAARPGVDPPPCEFNTGRTQRFAMLDSVFTMIGSDDGFSGFGTGRTRPYGGGDEVLAEAVGTIVEGRGRFRGCDGTYTYCGSLSSAGYRGNVLLRVMDPRELFTSDTVSQSAPDGEPLPGNDAYLLFAGHKPSSRSRTKYVYARDQVVGLDVAQQLRLLNVDCGAGPDGDLRCMSAFGPVAGVMTARVSFNLLNPGAPGTTDAPIPFRSYNRFEFQSGDGPALGSVDADGDEGRTFNLTLPGAPGQRALRFGGFGPLLNGRGEFAGIGGHMTDNSAVAVAPHAVATAYVFRLFDGAHTFRSA